MSEEEKTTLKVLEFRQGGNARRERMVQELEKVLEQVKNGEVDGIYLVRRFNKMKSGLDGLTTQVLGSLGSRVELLGTLEVAKVSLIRKVTSPPRHKK